MSGLIENTAGFSHLLLHSIVAICDFGWSIGKKLTNVCIGI